MSFKIRPGVTYLKSSSVTVLKPISSETKTTRWTRKHLGVLLNICESQDLLKQNNLKLQSTKIGLHQHLAFNSLEKWLLMIVTQSKQQISKRILLMLSKVVEAPEDKPHERPPTMSKVAIAFTAQTLIISLHELENMMLPTRMEILISLILRMPLTLHSMMKVSFKAKCKLRR